MKLTQAIVNAQLAHTRELIDAALKHGYGDDMYDYVISGLRLSQVLMEIKSEDDDATWQGLLAVDLADFACDGICQELYDLKPAALKEMMGDD